MMIQLDKPPRKQPFTVAMAPPDIIPRSNKDRLLLFLPCPERHKV